MWHSILWVIAVVLVIVGVWQIVNRAVLFGIVLIVLATAPRRPVGGRWRARGRFERWSASCPA
jgi:hypothetical protein